MRKAFSSAASFIALPFLLLRKRKNRSKRPIFHYSTIDALRNNAFIGELTVGKLCKKGDFGLGTYNCLDGEMIALDGVFYRASSAGEIFVAKADWKVPYACITFFAAEFECEIYGIKNIEMLENEILKRLPSANRPYALRIECRFEQVVVGCMRKIEKEENSSLEELLKDRPLFERGNVSGAIVGFYTPLSFGAIDLAPFHFHFISDDRLYGGHLVSGIFSAQAVKVGIQAKPGYEIILPEIMLSMRLGCRKRKMDRR
ncbi:MAG: acetolactate decarboxylase [Flavobacterium nitrogenifigens]|uniref:acetolactate decarboxylase n=1 Tax=Flavobacterium nitrogenifigens TaxID=1617283 RepID=UPI002806F029|nr:acetolactate decarboxylase [Flavobacterium nitrogenifigens]MDQ8013203.1 acetolactate decarboxylase [Flavobacterium nitrogenifigens]